MAIQVAPSINPKSKGVIPVVVFGSATFDVMTIDRSTLRFGRCGDEDARPVHKVGGHPSDENADRFTDLVSHYKTSDTDFERGDTQACVIGETVFGTPFHGRAAIRIVGSGSDREATSSRDSAPLAYVAPAPARAEVRDKPPKQDDDRDDDERKKAK